MPKTDFSPGANGFRFTNRFINNIVTLPIYGNISTSGRCGGMSYAALDCFFNHVPVPPYTDNDFPRTGGVPADGTPLADYIYHRQIESFLMPSAAKFITWTVSPDVATPFLRGVARWTKEDEFPKLRAAIDAGKPVTIGLIVAVDLANVGHNHQVVAYGYDVDAATGVITVHIYDCNHPGTDVTLTSSPDGTGYQESTGEKWRGFFVQDYRMQPPPANLADLPAAAPMAAKSLLPVAERKLSVTFDRAMLKVPGETRPHAAEKIALSLEVNGQTMRWPKRGARTVRPGKRYVIGKSVDVTVTDGEVLSVWARPIAPAHMALPLSDNDQPIPAISKEFASAENWGIGFHADTGGSAGGIYTVEYTITAQSSGNETK